MNANENDTFGDTFINGAQKNSTTKLPSAQQRITLEIPNCIIVVLCGKMSPFCDTQVTLTTVCLE